MTKEKGPTIGQPHNITQKSASDNTSEAQRGRLLAALCLGPVTTIAARRDHDVLCPAARIMELRRIGYRIATVWAVEQTDCGKWHRVARYVLAGEA